MKLYHCHNARSLRPLWALEEMGFEYELEVLRFPPRVFQKEYLGVNPLGTVPYLIDGETRMSESSAICHYLVERYGRHDFGIDPQHPEFGAYLNWLYFSDATLTFPQALIFRYRHLEPLERRLPQVVDDYTAFYLGRLRSVSAHLKAHTYLCDRRFTVADICVGFALYHGATPHVGLGDRYEPQVVAYLERLTSRPAFQRAVARSGS